VKEYYTLGEVAKADFLIKPKGFQYREPDFPVAQG